MATDFEFLFKKINGEWQYYDFKRMVRDIPQQKKEIHYLLAKDIDKFLIEKFSSDFEEGKTNIVHFEIEGKVPNFTDKYTFKNFKVGYFG